MIVLLVADVLQSYEVRTDEQGNFQTMVIGWTKTFAAEARGHRGYAERISPYDFSIN